jgi:hypothetical protein
MSRSVFADGLNLDRHAEPDMRCAVAPNALTTASD